MGLNGIKLNQNNFICPDLRIRKFPFQTLLGTRPGLGILLLSSR